MPTIRLRRGKTLPSATSVPAPMRILANLCTVHGDGTHADHDPVAQRAAMQDGAMPHRYPMPDSQGRPGIGMEDRAILDMALGADDDRHIVGADDGAEPDAGASAQQRLVDDVGGRRDPAGVAPVSAACASSN